MAWLDTRWRRIGAASGILVALFGIVGAFAIPAAVRWGLETVASRELGRTIRVEGVSANPYTLRVTLRGLTVDGQPGESAPLLTVREASINASVFSALRFAPVLEAIAVDGLAANVVRLEAQRFNFSDIVERLQARPRSDEPARFSLNNIEITGSSVSFDDRVVGTRHAITDIRIGIPFVSNLPTDAEITVEPALVAKIDGAPIDLQGETRPFHESRESSLLVKLDGLDIPKYLAFSPVKLDFDVPAGKLNTNVRIAFRQAVAATPERPAQAAQTLISGQFQVTGFALSAPAGAQRGPLVAWKSVDVSIDEFEPLQRRLVLADVLVDSPVVSVVRDRSGALNWLRFAQQPLQGARSPDRTADASPRTAAASAPYAFALKHASVRNGRVTLTDDLVGHFEQEMVNLQAEASGLTTTAADRGKFKLSADIKDNGSIALDGALGLAPVAGRLQYAARDVRLVVATRYLANVFNGTLDGSSSIDGTLEFGQADTGLQLALRDIVIAGKDIKLRGPADGGAALDISSLQVSGGALDFTGRTVTIDKLTVDGPRIVVRRLRDGSINWQQVARAGAAGGEPLAAATASPAAPWAFRLKEAEVARGDVVIEDVAVAPAVKLRASALSATVKNVVGDGSERAEFTARTRFGSGGTLSASGNVRWDALAATVRVDARNLDIAAVRPYVAGYLNATLARAELSGRGAVTVAQASGRDMPLKFSYKGTARLSNLHALDGSGESDLLKWQVLDLDGVDVQAGAGAPLIGLGKVTLSDFYARVILSEQGRLNLADLIKRGGASPGADATAVRPGQTAGAVPGSTGAAAPPTPAAGGDPAARPTIRIGSIEFVRGNVNFTDNFIKPNYSANMTGLGGTVTALASDSIEPATMALAGEIDDEAPVEIRGQLNPLAPMLFLDIEGHTKGVDLPRMTPYSAKYAGYPILKGKLSMDVRYKVEAQKLQASNHLFIDQLTFGDKVDSPTATKLPVLLAVSLLKNTRGEIDINLPISGSLDDPKFSVGGIIVQVIVNLLAKVVTAPFALLAAAFGGGEELGYVEFAPGAATLGAAQLQRLDTLAKALNDRPGLKLDIVGRVEPTADAEGVRRAKYEAKLRGVKLRQLTRGGGESVDPAKVTISDQERPALIAAVYADEKIPDKPRNVIGIAKAIPAPEMEQLILKNLTASPDDLRALATARAAVVRDYIEHTGKVQRDRLFLVEPKLNAEGIKDKGAPTRVDFSLK
jgi:uncharacterized protein involved in outer membrane biogenesis